MDVQVKYPENLLIDSTGYDSIPDDAVIAKRMEGEILPESYKKMIAEATPEMAVLLQRRQLRHCLLVTTSNPARSLVPFEGRSGIHRHSALSQLVPVQLPK